MAYLVLARKWRPTKFEDLIGQEHITRSLRNAIANNRLAQAILFSGTRGIGKTSAARIFAKALRCLGPTSDHNPCGKCQECLSIGSDSSMDVVEIDGASNNSVDNIRQLAENVQYLPTSGKYKIYIIDEVHMLSSSAFNALLKTLEEPPAHVIFLFATTEPEKVIDTVLSRCQKFTFRSVDLPTLIAHLKMISSNEGITFDKPRTLEVIAQMAGGSFRDALSLLEQLLVYAEKERITEETLRIALGVVPSEEIIKITSALLAEDSDALLKILNELFERQINLKLFVLSFLEYFYGLTLRMDDTSALAKELGLPTSLLESIEAAEYFWLYETLSKDLERALTSLLPEKSLIISLLKVSKRSSFFQKKKKRVEPRLEPRVEPSSHQTPETILEQVAVPSSDSDPNPLPDSDPAPVAISFPTIEELLSKMRVKYPLIASNLEQGHLAEFYRRDEMVECRWNFGPEAKLFFDYLSTSESQERLSKILPELLQTKCKVRLQPSLLSENEVVELQYISFVEKLKKTEIQSTENRRENFLNQDSIKEAQELFNAKIEQIIIK